MLFLDSDVILDYLLNREPYVDGVHRILSSNKKLGTTVIVISNVFYFLGKEKGKNIARSELQSFRKVLVEIDLKFDDIDSSLNSNFKDKEDGFNYYACLRNPEVEAIITRTVKNFTDTEIPVYTPEEYLSRNF